jgi:hypothetical protein
MSEAMTQPAANDAAPDPWGQARRGEAQLTMRAVLCHLNEPYTGVALADGEITSEGFKDADTAARHFESALVAEMQRMGVEVRKLVKAGEDPLYLLEDIYHVTDWEGRFICTFEEEPALNAIFMETVAISGGMAGGMAPAGEVACGIIEACAEMMRALLSGAVVGAFNDGVDETDVVVIFHAGPEVAHRVSMKDGGISALLRVRGAVYSREDPERSYLLGENAERMGEGKTPLQVIYPLPLVEYIYGPNRLRWKDKRSAPSYAPPKVVVS